MIRSFMPRFLFSGLTLCLAISLIQGPGNTSVYAAQTGTGSQAKTPIEHLIVLMQENHSFDNYFGTYPGAEGIPAGTCIPVDPFDPNNKECVKPFHIGDNEVEPGDLDHSQRTYALQYNKGKMDGFVYALNLRKQDGRAALGYYDDRDLPFYWNLADEYVLFDHFFSSAAGGSFINHVYWVAARSNGNDRLSSESMDHITTIFDLLEARGISWKFYVQNYDPDLTYRTVLNYPGNRAAQIIWCPLLNIDRFLDDTRLSSHIVDLDEYYEDLNNDTLPAVAYIVPSGPSEHPPSSLRAGQNFTRTLIQRLKQSEAWYNSAFLLAYDDWGGWYDHVTPPQVDKDGYGFRVPALLVSPYAKRGYIDKTVLDFTSILKFIQENWDVEPLSERDAKANNFTSAFDFSQAPRSPRFIPAERTTTLSAQQPRRDVLYFAYGGVIMVSILFFIGAAGGLGVIRRRLTRSSRAQRGDYQP